jgi:hypothetical protein
VQAARAAAEKLKDLALQHQFELNDIQRAGADEYQKVESENFEFEQTLADAKREIDKGKAGDQGKINALLERAHELTRDITSTQISLAETDDEVSSARYSAARRLNDLYDEQKRSLEQVQKAHEDNADVLAKKQQEALEKLEMVNGEIDKIAAKLEQEFQMQIHVDTTQVDAAIAKLDSIPTDKYVTIHTQTVNDGSGNVQAQQAGGPIQKFMSGGWPRANGQIPGFGGGDKVKLLAEQGEFVVRKEGVKQLQSDYGPNAMWEINRGRLPLRRAEGGPVTIPFATNFLNTGNWLHDFGGSFSSIIEIPWDRAFRIQIQKNLRFQDQYHDWMLKLLSPPEKLLKSLQEAEKSLKKNIENIKIPPIQVPAVKLNADLASAKTKSTSSDTVTLRFQAPSGRTASVHSNKSDVANVLQVLKEAGAVTV